MFCRHVDFFAIAVITLGLLAFSKASALDWPDRGGSLNFRNAIRLEYCPIPDHVLSSLAHILNR
jgi:hypothetical protein